jgi:GrpB-like predicted nucleotidyltransferase (UPF0157 family)
MRRVVVVDYDPAWPATFDGLRARVWPAVTGLALAIEHIGSTSVPGLAAKPIIDMTVVLPSANEVPRAIERLATIGYVHRGDLGIEGREAFGAPVDLPAHHLYVCPERSLGLLNPLAVRDHLLIHPETARAYGDLKKSLAAEFPYDIESYVTGKTDFILKILRKAGFTSNQLDAIERMNRKSVGGGV